MRKLAILLAVHGAVGRLPDERSAAAAGAAMIDLNNPLFAPGFLAQAASGDQFEIQSSQLALADVAECGGPQFRQHDDRRPHVA